MGLFDYQPFKIQKRIQLRLGEKKIKTLKTELIMNKMIPLLLQNKSFLKKTTLFLFFMSVTLHAQIDKVEPPFWYAGMKNTELQLLFYGKDIAQCKVSVSNGIQITNVTKTENSNYIFVTINTKKVTASDFVFTFKNNNATLLQKYSLKKRRENSAQRKSFDSSDMM